jgi:hypothetical protein
MGISPATIWSTVPQYDDSFKFKWYGADVEVASLSGIGNFKVSGYANVGGAIQGASSLTIAGAASGITTLAAGNTTITGFANVTTTLQVGGVATFANNVGIGNTSPGEKLTVAGTIESTTGGVKFPDATTQTTAVTAGRIFALNTIFGL